MNKLLALLILSGIFSFSLLACELPQKEKLVIGCSYKCDFFYKLRLSMVARQMGYPLQIVDLTTMGSLDQSLAQVDGVLLPGGADIDPTYYLSHVTPELQKYTESNLKLVNYTQEGRVRDPFEYQLLSRYSNEDKFSKIPVLGICRGMQMMSVAQGIPLYLDIKTELGIKNRRFLFDRVTFTDDGQLKQVYGRSQVSGFKLHHQGIRVPYFKEHENDFPHAKITGFSHNSMIAEVIEYTHRPAIGVQYHPEKSLPNTANPIFRWLLKKSCEYKNSHKDN